MSKAIRRDTASARAVFRIAIPFWTPRFGKARAEKPDPDAVRREEFKRLLEAALVDDVGIRGVLNRKECRDTDAARRIRRALYDGLTKT